MKPVGANNIITQNMMIELKFRSATPYDEISTLLPYSYLLCTNAGIHARTTESPARDPDMGPAEWLLVGRDTYYSYMRVP